MRRLGIVAVGLALVVGIVVSGMRFARLTDPAEAQAPPNVVEAHSGCLLTGHGPQDVFFFFGSDTKWDAAWIDLSLQDNGFAPGTFLSAGPFPAEYMASAVSDRVYNNYFVWTNLTPGLTHYWRVNLLYGDQWYPSATQTYYVPFDCAPTPAASPVPSVSPPISLTTSDLESLVDDLEQRLDRLEGATFGGFGGPPLFGPSLDSRIDTLESEVESLRSCLNTLYIDCFGNSCEIGCN
jgi:hypothetical protein